MDEIGTREFHPAANLFPLLEGAAFDALVADIKQNGLREPILVDTQGRILDGRNRCRACLAAGVEPRFTTWQGVGLKNQSQPPDPDLEERAMLELVMSRNLHRRHLNQSQRALVAARLAKLLETDAVKRRGRRPEKVANLPRISLGKSRDQAAATVNVSPRLVAHALRLLSKGSPELVQAVESGAMPVSMASRLAAGAPRPPRPKRARASEPWPFGLLTARQPADSALAYLWVAQAGLTEAVDALRDRGFHFTPHYSD
jgi:hypothetical protein